MDVESIDSGTFGEIILNQIAARPHFLVVLVPGTLDRCSNTDDWLRREIEHAIDLERNVVPLLIEGFCFEQHANKLPRKLVRLKSYNALPVPHD
jgi:hypothetical protein